MSRTIETEITLPATPAQVWAVLTDFAAYPEWNPFVRRIDGKAEAGASLCIRLAPTLRWTMGFCAKLVDWQAPQHFAWAGGPAWLLHGRHYFELQPSVDGHSTTLRHGETYRGLLTPLFFCLLGKDPAAGYAAMNEALKQRLAALPAAVSPPVSAG